MRKIDLEKMELINTEEAARIIGCSQRNVQDLCARRVLESLQVGRALLLSRLDAEMYADYREQRGPRGPRPAHRDGRPRLHESADATITDGAE